MKIPGFGMISITELEVLVFFNMLLDSCHTGVFLNKMATGETFL